MLLALVLTVGMQAEPESLFLDLCGSQATPACSTYLLGFMDAMAAQRKACLPRLPDHIDMPATRQAALLAVRARRGTPENVVLLTTLSKLYPCKK